MSIRTVLESQRRRQRANKPIVIAPMSEDQAVKKYMQQLFTQAHEAFLSHPHSLGEVCLKFKEAYETAKARSGEETCIKALLGELCNRLNYTENSSPSLVDRAALELIQHACEIDSNLIPEVMNSLFDSEEADWKYKLNNLITMMQSPTAIMNLLLTLYKNTPDSNIKGKITEIIQMPFKLYIRFLSKICGYSVAPSTFPSGDTARFAGNLAI